MRRFIPILLLTTFTTLADPLVVGYLPDYRIETWTPPTESPLTDIIFFGIEALEGGVLPNVPVPPAQIDRAHALKNQLKTRLLLCVGGWGRSAHFPATAADDAARARLITSLRDFCLANDFDGIDYDWEHPKDDAEMANYVRLLTETRAAFKEDGLLVTIALASWQDIGPEGYAAVDRVHLMSYDQAFPQATLAQSIRDVETLLANGCPPEKVLLGVPFYGRNQDRDTRSYADLTADHEPDPGVDEIDGFAFNGVDTVKAKMNFVTRKNLGGLMIWELSHDGGKLLKHLQGDTVSAQ